MSLCITVLVRVEGGVPTAGVRSKAAAVAHALRAHEVKTPNWGPHFSIV